MAPQDYMGGRFYVHRREFEPPPFGQEKGIMERYDVGKATAIGMKNPSVVALNITEGSTTFIISEDHHEGGIVNGIVLENAVILEFGMNRQVNVEGSEKLIVDSGKYPVPISKEQYQDLVAKVGSKDYGLLSPMLREITGANTPLYPPPRIGGIKGLLPLVREFMESDF